MIWKAMDGCLGNKKKDSTQCTRILHLWGLGELVGRQLYPQFWNC